MVDRDAIPGEIRATDNGAILSVKAGDTYEYDAIVTEKENYCIGVTAESSGGAQIKLSFGEQELGIIQVGAANQLYEVEGMQEMTIGKNKLKMTVVSGEAKVSSIVIRVRDRVAVPGCFDAIDYEGSTQKTGNLDAK